VNAVIVDPELGRSLDRMFRGDLQDANPVLEEQWRNRPMAERAIEWACWLVRYLL